jgi:hypothetical protein
MPPASIAALALIATALGGAANAQTAPPSTVFPPPRFLAGFTHPDINQCRTVNASLGECTAPANVGGRYLIEAAGFATSSKADALLTMNITVGDQICITENRSKFSGRGFLHLICEVTLATDAPTNIYVNLAARGATLDVQGPRIVIHNLPWDGVVSVRGSDGGPLTPSPAAPSSSPPTPAKPGH